MTAQPRRRTVLFVVSNLQTGGMERVMIHLVNGVDRRSFRPVLALGVAEGSYLSDLHDDVELHELGHRRARGAIPGLVRTARRVRPDVIMSAGGMNFAACMVHPLLSRETRLVLREANTTSAFLADVARTKPLLARAYRATYRALYRRADAVVCQSEFMVDDLAGIGVPRARLRRVYNPVDIDRVRELARAAPPPPVPGGPRLIAVGRLHHQKGYDVLLDAVARLRERHPDLRLAILGEGEERSDLERQIAHLSLKHSVTLPGTSTNPYPAIAAADLLVSSSRYEGFSNAIVEAHALGIPVVATDCPSANREVIDPGVNGWLAPTEDATGLADTIDGALATIHAVDPRLIAARCQERFAVSTVMAEYEEVFACRARP